MLERIIEFYRNLLIIQYNSQPKAAATIDAVVDQILANVLFIDVRDGFDIDTAVGEQLDVIGKYVGVDRSFIGADFSEDYFSVVEYTESSPYASNRKGLVETADWTASEGSWLTYNDIVSTTNLLLDSEYRTLIKLKILFNNMNVSQSQIDNAVFETFGSEIVPDSTGNMKMIYFIGQSLSKIAGVAVEKKVLPKPSGVQIQYFIQQTQDFFQIPEYGSLQETDGFTGFTTQADFDSQSGEVLTYNKLIEV